MRTYVSDWNQGDENLCDQRSYKKRYRRILVLMFARTRLHSAAVKSIPTGHCPAAAAASVVACCGAAAAAAAAAGALVCFLLPVEAVVKAGTTAAASSGAAMNSVCDAIVYNRKSNDATSFGAVLKALMMLRS